jgi:hypothetical protein
LHSRDPQITVKYNKKWGNYFLTQG